MHQKHAAHQYYMSIAPSPVQCNLFCEVAINVLTTIYQHCLPTTRVPNDVPCRFEASPDLLL